MTHFHSSQVFIIFAMHRLAKVSSQVRGGGGGDDDEPTPGGDVTPGGVYRLQKESKERRSLKEKPHKSLNYVK